VIDRCQSVIMSVGLERLPFSYIVLELVLDVTENDLVSSTFSCLMPLIGETESVSGCKVQLQHFQRFCLNNVFPAVDNLRTSDDWMIRQKVTGTVLCCSVPDNCAQS